MMSSFCDVAVTIIINIVFSAAVNFIIGRGMAAIAFIAVIKCGVNDYTVSTCRNMMMLMVVAVVAVVEEEVDVAVVRWR